MISFPDSIDGFYHLKKNPRQYNHRGIVNHSFSSCKLEFFISYTALFRCKRLRPG